MSSTAERLPTFSLEIESSNPIAEFLQADIKWLQNMLLETRDPIQAAIAKGLQRKSADRLLKLPAKD